MATYTEPPPKEPIEQGGLPWVPVAWFGVLLVVAYAPVLRGIAGSWFDERADMQHGILAPLAAGYIVWLKRGALVNLPSAPNRWGLVLVSWAVVQLAVSLAGRWFFASRVAFLMSLIGCILLLKGAAAVRELAFPLILLILMIPPPTFLYEGLTLRLQFLASRLAEAIMEILGYSVLREGNILELVGERLAVAEACSGIRSMVTLLFFSLIYNYFLVRQVWIRWVILAAVVPLAILGNALRIVLAGAIGEYNRELAHGVLHAASGYVIIVVAGLLCLMLHRVLVRVSTR